MAFFKEVKKDLGDIQSGSVHTIQFDFDSITMSDIKSMQAGCGCSTPSKKNTHIEVVYNSAGHSGTISKVVTVTLDDKKFHGFNENGTEKNVVKLEFTAKII